MNDISVRSIGIRKPAWSSRLPPFCSKVLGAMRVDGWEVSILLCDEGTMRLLNGKYRRHNRPTDVLSFRQEDRRSPGQREIAGDIVICPRVLAENARQWGVPRDEELKRLVVHGMLHLAGMDHGDGNRGKMITLQEKLLCEFAYERILPRTHGKGPGSRRIGPEKGAKGGGDIVQGRKTRRKT